MGKSLAKDSREPAWLGVSTTPAKRPQFYSVSLLVFELAVQSPNTSSLSGTKTINVEFDSDDDINDILKQVRTNEVWNKKVDFAILLMPKSVFAGFQILRMRECVITLVSKKETRHMWTIEAEKAELVVQK